MLSSQSHNYTKPNLCRAPSHKTVPKQTHAELPVTQLYQTKPSLSSLFHNYTKTNQTLAELHVTQLFQTKPSLSSLLHNYTKPKPILSSQSQRYQTKPMPIPQAHNYTKPNLCRAPSHTTILKQTYVELLVTQLYQNKPMLSF